MGQPLSRPRSSCWNCCSRRKDRQNDDDLEDYYVPQRSAPEPVSPGSQPEPKKKGSRWKVWKRRRARVSQVLEAGVSQASPRELSTVLTQQPGQPDHRKPTSRGSLSQGHQQETLESAGMPEENVRASVHLREELLAAGLDIPITCQSRVSLGGAGSPPASIAGCTKEAAGHCQDEDSEATLELLSRPPEHDFSGTDSDSLQEFQTPEALYLSKDEGDGASPGSLEVQTTRMSPPCSSPGSMEHEEEEGHPEPRTGHLLRARYEFVTVLGEGAFGQVMEFIDHQEDNRHVAVKFVKDVDPRRAYHAEVSVLQYLNSLDPSGTHHCVRMLDWFEHRGHVCIVFELLGPSTYSFIVANGFRPFRVDDIRRMGYQLCEAVNFLHINGLTHTDLKPDNILLVNSEYTEEYNASLKQVERRPKDPSVKVADFGNATRDDEPHCPLVSTRPYRAPEIILALGWSQPCDVWSIGCILLEYYLGFPVFTVSFDAYEDIEHLAKMERILGPLPRDMIKKTRRGDYYCHGRLVWDQHSLFGRYASQHCKPLKAYMTCSTEEHCHLFDLIEKMLQYDPAERITLQEALKHPFFFPLQREKRASPLRAEGADTGVSPPKKPRKIWAFVTCCVLFCSVLFCLWVVSRLLD
ncbi:dual specificity protein kinase CLK1-like [Heliangelus exortis]|uniref:dual specificity protein kinase CLK1-like n=1 Tax=Heliangelus exortis TaxID=472823 RepID=UPI003A926837